MAETTSKKEKKSLKEKLSVLQSELKVPKNLYNSFGKYNYRNAEGILEAVKPKLRELRLVMNLEDSLEVVGERIFIKATASLFDLDAEEMFKTSAYAEIGNHAGMSPDQAAGCASSYARKYALNGLFLLDDAKDEDTDEFKREKDSKAANQSQTKTNSYKETSKPAEAAAGAKTDWGLK